MDFWDEFWNIIWWTLWFTLFIAYLFALFAIITDVFRDKNMNGGLKAVWLIFLLFFPIVTALIYVIARGKSMGERNMEAAAAQQQATESYIRGVARTSATEEIAKAKELLDSGAITASEYEALKAKALSGRQTADMS
jgi:H+/Cl- antiporter ClcA